MPFMKLIANNIVKRFGDHLVLKKINFEIETGKALAIVGHNGSGKTTLVKILANLIAPSRGKVEYRLPDGTLVPRERIFEHIGLVGPYLQLYQELSAQENLDFFARMRGLKNHRERIRALMQILGLQGREHDAVKTYSSGMQQRLKYVSALLHQPEVLLVDEPSSNLDEQGVETVYQLLKEQKQRGILIIATNDKQDLFLADHIIQVKPI